MPRNRVRSHSGPLGAREVVIHPLAGLFPMMSRDELDALTEDIRQNGLREPIKLLDGAVLDGRNRLRACERAGVEPRFEDVDGGDPLSYVISANVKRRKMFSKAQRAIAAAESWGKPGVGKRPKRGNLSKSSAADDFGPTLEKMARRWEINETYVTMASALVEGAAELAAQVKAGSKSLEEAYEELQAVQRESRERDGSLARLRREAPDLAERVERGALSLGEAVTLLNDRQKEAREQARRDAETQRLLVEQVSQGIEGLSYGDDYEAFAQRIVGDLDEKTRGRIAGAQRFLTALSERI